MDEFELRAATPADADAVADYHHLCFTTTYSSQLLAGEFEAPDLAGTSAQLRDWFQPGSECETRVAVVDGAPIGHVTVRGHQLVHLFVEPDHQKMGLGRHLLGHGEAMIAAGGHRDVHDRRSRPRAGHLRPATADAACGVNVGCNAGRRQIRHQLLVISASVDPVA